MAKEAYLKSKEAYLYRKRGLFVREKRLICTAKEAINVTINMSMPQVRDVFERSLEDVSTFLERYAPLSDEEFEVATQGKNEVAYMPPFKIRIILQAQILKKCSH